MRNWIDIVSHADRTSAQTPLNEEWLGTTHNGADVFRNPSRAELAKLIRRSNNREVRAFLSKNLYVWDSEVAHHDFPTALLAPEDASCALFKDEEGRECVNLHIGLRGPYIAAVNVPFEDDEETPTAAFAADKAFVENHPIMKRLFGTFNLPIED